MLAVDAVIRRSLHSEVVLVNQVRTVHDREVAGVLESEANVGNTCLEEVVGMFCQAVGETSVAVGSQRCQQPALVAEVVAWRGVADPGLARQRSEVEGGRTVRGHGPGCRLQHGLAELSVVVGHVAILPLARTHHTCYLVTVKIRGRGRLGAWRWRQPVMGMNERGGICQLKQFYPSRIEQQPPSSC